MEIVSGLIGFIGAILGAIIAGYYSRQATQDLLNEERAKRVLEKHERVNGLLCTIEAEVRSVWSHYMTTAGTAMEGLRDYQPFKYKFAIEADYFPVYHGSVSSLGLVEDAVLRSKIISTYNLAKSLVDTFRMNNELFKDCSDATDRVFYNNTSQTQQVLKIKEQNLVAYGPMLKDLHARTKTAVEDLLQALESANKKT